MLFCCRFCYPNFGIRAKPEWAQRFWCPCANLWVSLPLNFLTCTARSFCQASCGMGRGSVALECAVLSRAQQQYFLSTVSIDCIHHGNSWLKTQNKTRSSLACQNLWIWHLDEVLTDPSHNSSVAQAQCRMALGLLLPSPPKTPFLFPRGRCLSSILGWKVTRFHKGIIVFCLVLIAIPCRLRYRCCTHISCMSLIRGTPLFWDSG